jgi:hypothetical protein
LKHSDASITTILGMRGCGKSTLTQKLSVDHPRKIVFDFVQEWNTGTHYVYSYDEFCNIWREIFNLPSYIIVIQFDFGVAQETIIDIQTNITKLIYLSGRDSEIETCIIFEEAHFYFPTHGLHPNNMHLLTTGRHAFINIIANTQRPASLSKLLLSQSKELYIGSLYEMNDIKYLADCVGSLAFEARELKPFEFIYYPVGDRENISIIQL